MTGPIANTPKPRGSGAPGGRSRKQRNRDALINTSLRSALRPESAAGAAVWTAVLLALLWLLVIIDAADDHHLLRFGIRPRTGHGLTGIVLSPLLHANAAHLAANTIPFAAMCWLTLWSGLRTFAIVTATVWLCAGAVDWLVGPSHAEIVGASGVIFGWMGYILARAWFSRSIRWIAIAVVVACVFSGSFAGLLPHLDSHVFWVGHVIGFGSGIAVAGVLHRRGEDDALPGTAKRKAVR